METQSKNITWKEHLKEIIVNDSRKGIQYKR